MPRRAPALKRGGGARDAPPPTSKRGRRPGLENQPPPSKRRAVPQPASPPRPPLRSTQAAAAAEEEEEEEEEVSAYEKARAATVARNRARLAELRLTDLAVSVSAAAGGGGGPKPRRTTTAAAAPRRGGRKEGRPPTAPARASGRARGLGPGAPVPLEPYAPPPPPPRRSSTHTRHVPHRPPRANAGRAAAAGVLYRPADFWAAVPGGNPCPDPLISDGVFRGDVHPGVAAACGIPLREPLPDGVCRATRPPLIAPPRGGYTSAARAAAAAALRSNPNAYFYRHPPPGVVQATGPWTKVEADAFLATARAYGVGSHWGLFASHIPTGRVGYQCAAFYRDVAIPSGAVLDDRFALTGAGKAVWVGES